MRGDRNLQNPMFFLANTEERLAADATCARLMGLVPEHVPHIAQTAKFLGHMSSDRIEHLAVPVISPPAPFQTVQDFEHLRSKSGLVSGAHSSFRVARHPRVITKDDKEDDIPHRIWRSPVFGTGEVQT